MTEENNMEKKEHIFSILEGMGYSPQNDEDGDVFMMYQMKPIYFLPDENDYLSVMLPQFIDVDGDEITTFLAVCNKMTREVKMAKIFLDSSYKTLTATCEFYYIDDEALRCYIRHSLQVLSVMRSMFYKAKKELTY